MDNKSLDELKTFYQLQNYAEEQLWKSSREGRLYWQGVKDGIRRTGVVLGLMSKEDCEEIGSMSRYRSLINKVVGKNKI